ncbi:dihydrodipicolinate synthase family protein [Nonomuraea aridisoli]|uniref:Dihydrodipicolinate synthase family protein n=1 Tax=Nonomuraea aridisoli TaxID=2070368 RepID=A0A2W2DP60_9ACTN|nr:dihydrodipicolinate synthase family protein [Nonomuraea aridisoli]PZG12443.1 dihydrodipicolinate synthase family protein [Nonomuraea aridisoli]
MSTPIDPRAARLRDRLRGALVAAAATPMTRSGEVDLDVAEAYYRRLTACGADALAVLAHTGRGPFLAPDVRAGLIARAVRTGVPVIAGVGGGRSLALEEAPEEARMAAELGADGVLVFPSQGDRAALHEQVWAAAGLPMIAFDLYTDPCPPAALGEILRHPGVAGLKTALLSDAMGCQRTIALTREAGRLAITGEDRMFGPSLLWGAQAALVGIAAASVETTAAVLRAFEGDDLRGFEKASARLDRLAAATFTAPMEGYVQRMLWLAAAEGLIPESHAFDPYGPGLPEPERASVLAATA